MLVSNSATTALQLLSGANAQSPDTSSSSPSNASDLLSARSSPEGGNSGQMAKITAHSEKLAAWMQGLQDGTVSPEDRGPGSFSRVQHQDPRKVDSGAFFASQAPSEGGDLIVKDAAFTDRKAAVMNAYHFGTSLLENAQRALKFEAAIARGEEQLEAYRHQITTGEGDAYDPKKGINMVESSLTYSQGAVAEAKLNIERASASLSRMFSFTATPLTEGANGQNEFTGFSLSHGDYGKIMEVSSEGEITMFDAAGKSYSREEYVAAKPEGLIGEMYNDLIDEADRALPVNEKLEKALGTPVTIRSMTTIDVSDITRIDVRV